MSIADHRIGTREEWQAARERLLEREEEHTHLGNELARQRRDLPWAPDKEYRFDTERGTHSLVGAPDVIAELENLFSRHGKPLILRSDNGRKFIAATLLEWLAEQGVQPAFIERGSPQQNPWGAQIRSPSPGVLIWQPDLVCAPGWSERAG